VSGRVAALVRALAARGETVAAAESLTAGLLLAALTEAPGASAVVRGGLVVYGTDLKARLAGVPEALLAERGPVDPDVAAALAEGARERCGASIGLGLTGVAGPGPQDGVPAGTVYVALASPRGGQVSLLRATGGRAAVRAAAVEVAVGLLEDDLATIIE
jgi:nicotinamide-nucleotide amidase